ncbi:MAG: Tfp pilus assembly protein FimT/FimU [Candidatus Aminicenantia bacterium]
MKEKGFSLLEVLTAISIMGILLTLSLPALQRMAPKYQLKRATREITSRLTYAKNKAIFQGTKFKVKFYKDGYAVEKFDSIQNEWKQEEKTILERVDISANNSPTFHPNGTVSNLASIYVSNSTGKYKITIAISGRIKAAKI